MSSFTPPGNRFCYSFRTEAPNCARKLIFGFNKADTQIIVYFADKHLKKYAYLATTDIYGEVEIDTTLFPQGLLNPYAGAFTVYAIEAGGSGQRRLFFRNDLGYFPSLELTIVDINYANFSPNDPVVVPHRVDMYTFRCCCTKNHYCENVDLDPCDSEVEDTTECPPEIAEGSVYWRSGISDNILEDDTERDMFIDPITHTHEVFLEMRAEIPVCCGNCYRVEIVGYTVTQGALTIVNNLPDRVNCYSTTLLQIFAHDFDNTIVFDFMLYSNECDPIPFSKTLNVIVP